MIPSQGRNEVALLDSQEKIDNVHIIRQYPITKLGYVVDGYCPETNTVYEVYERYHNRQVQKDLGRETEICNMLSCNFHIIWDTNF
jgi:very-short-patch-repair endonuclease